MSTKYEDILKNVGEYCEKELISEALKENILKILNVIGQSPKLSTREKNSLLVNAWNILKLNRNYGFVFDYAPSQISNTPALHYLKADTNKTINASPLDDKNQNHLIISENYYALQNLLVAGFRDKVDIIYIDPPYNTKEMQSYADKFGRDGWLSMMKERLELAKELLSDDGVIFVSIDDSEQAYLKVLMDEIFGEDNFKGNLTIEITKTQGMKVKSAQSGTVAKNHEYILMYSLRLQPIKHIMYDFTDYYDEHYSSYLVNETHKNCYFIPLIEFLNSDENVRNIFNHFQKKISIKNIKYVSEIDENFRNFLYMKSDRIFQISMVGKQNNIIIKKLEETKGDQRIAYKENKYILFKNSKGTIRQFQSLKRSLHLSNDYFPRYGRTSIRGTLWKKFYLDMMNISKEGGINFKNGKKPVRLIFQLIKWVEKNKNSLILDFFAGSGTTGHAVMDLNREDGGKRKFILVTNDEYIRENNKIKIFTDEEGNEKKIKISEVCYERLYRVMTANPSEQKTKNQNNEDVFIFDQNDFKWNKNNKPYTSETLNYYEVRDLNITLNGTTPNQQEISKILSTIQETYRRLGGDAPEITTTNWFNLLFPLLTNANIKLQDKKS